MSTIIQVKDLNLWYGAHHALHGVNIDIPEHEITALIGPSGCGKSTFLKTLNRMNDLVPGIRIEGEVNYAGHAARTAPFRGLLWTGYAQGRRNPLR